MKTIPIKSWLFGLSCIALMLGGCGTNRIEDRTETPKSSTPQSEVRSSADVVKVGAASLSLPAGGNADATITLSISSGFHVNANPATYPYLIPTEITAATVAGITTAKPIYPKAEKRNFAFAKESLAVYEGEAQIKLSVRAEKNVKPGMNSMPLNVRVQACDHEQCFPPADLKTTVAIEVK